MPTLVIENEYEKRGAPKIGGSVGGFIALVVCLCLIIVISCTAIFLLLRDRDPSESERAHRRRKHREEVQAKYLAPQWTSKVAHIFSSGKPKGAGDDNNHRGWVQAGTTDEWDTESLDGGREMTYSEHDPPFRPPFPSNSVDSASSVHFDLGTLPKMPSFPSPRASLDHNYMYHPHHSGSSSDNDTPPRVLSPEPMTIRSRSASPTIRNDGAPRKSSTQSTQRTFSGGTKFIESI